MAPRVESRHTYCACDNFWKVRAWVTLCVNIGVYVHTQMWMCVFVFQRSPQQAGALNKNVHLVIQCGARGIRKANVYVFYLYVYVPRNC